MPCRKPKWLHENRVVHVKDRHDLAVQRMQFWHAICLWHLLAFLHPNFWPLLALLKILVSLSFMKVVEVTESIHVAEGAWGHEIHFSSFS